MNLAHKLGLHEDTYSVTIPLGATINMAGAAITINVLTLAAAHTLGIEVSFASALLLSLVATVSAGGASGVAPPPSAVEQGWLSAELRKCVRLLPHRDTCGGFFVACFHKEGSAAAQAQEAAMLGGHDDDPEGSFASLARLDILYLGATVLHICDARYPRCLWPQYEFWLSLQAATAAGLAPSDPAVPPPP